MIIFLLLIVLKEHSDKEEVCVSKAEIKINTQTTQTVTEPQIQIPDSNPFNIQFDDLLGGGNTNKSNGLSAFDDQYNSDFTSLLNMWN